MGAAQFPAVEQARTEYVFLSPGEWKENWVVIGTEKGNDISLDGASPAGCTVHDAGTLDGKDYEARRCPLEAGVHRMSGTASFQIMAYGYSDADAYAFAGGANIKKIYTPPPILRGCRGGVATQAWAVTARAREPSERPRRLPRAAHSPATARNIVELARCNCVCCNSR